MQHIRARRPDQLDAGPLGVSNYRQQLGRSVELGVPTKYGLAMTLVQAGATQRTGDKGAGAEGLAGRAAGDSLATLLQVTCTYAGANDANNTRPLAIRGRIDWGTDGHQAQAYFDWFNGTVLQVSASFVKVTAEVVPNYGSGDAAPTYSDTAIVTVGATVGYAAANRPAPTLTQQLRLSATPPAAPTAVVAIPRFARRLWWLGPALTSAEWAMGPGALQLLGQVDPLGVTTRQPYERPGFATHLQLTGNVGAATLNHLVWELAL